MTSDKLTKEILANSIPEWNNPGFTDRLMQQIVAAEARKTRRRLGLILLAITALVALTAYALVNLVKTKPFALSAPVSALRQIGGWISGKEYLLLPLVVLLFVKKLIDTLSAHRSNPIRTANS